MNNYIFALRLYIRNRAAKARGDVVSVRIRDKGVYLVYRSAVAELV